MELGPISKRDLYGDELGRIAEKMNLIHGVRVGWDDKQRYRDWLIEMASRGVISSDEFEARMEWVDAVHTERELNIALMDLPGMPLTERPKPKEKKGRGTSYFIARSPVYSGIIAGFEWAVFFLGVVTGQAFPMIIGGAFGLAWTLLTIKRINDEKDKI
jgi:Domain of unknown function (DUF1707)